MKVHSEKFMNVSDMQVSDEDGYLIVLLSNITIKANSKVVKERIVTRIIASPARLSYSLCGQSLRPVARGTYDDSAKEFAHRVPPARRRRWSADR